MWVCVHVGVGMCECGCVHVGVDMCECECVSCSQRYRTRPGDRKRRHSMQWKVSEGSTPIDTSIQIGRIP